MKQDGEGYYLTRDDRTLPADLQAVPDLRLRIWNVGFKRFDQLAGLPNLSSLIILDYTADTVAPLEGLRALTVLGITHFPHVHSLAPLGGLVNLEHLTLQTLPGWDSSRKRQVVESFAPLAGMTRMRTLHLGGVLAEDGDLSPFGAMAQLEAFAIGNMYPQAQFARLSALLPNVQSNFLAPYLSAEWSECKKCGSTKVMLSGSDVPNPKVICPTCNKKKFDAVVARFEELRRAS